MSWGGGQDWTAGSGPRHMVRSTRARSPSPSPSPRRDLLVALAILVTVAVIGGALLLSGGSDASRALTTPTTSPPTAPEAVFAAAAQAMEDSGGFDYRFSGRWEIEGLDTGETELMTEAGSGTVRLPRAAHHTVTTDDGLRRDLIVTDGAAFARMSAFPDQIEQRPWIDLDDLGMGQSDQLDPTALPDWLAAATDHRDGGEDGEGRMVVRAEVPPGVVPPAALDLGGSDEQTLTSAIELTVDAELSAVRVVVSATTQSAVVELVFDGIEPVADAPVAAPAGAQLDATPTLNEEDIAVVQAEGSLGLAGVPEGWLLISGMVTPNPTDAACASVELSYIGPDGGFDPESGPADFLILTMSPVACEPDFTGGEEPNFFAGELDGFATELADGNFGAVQMGETLVAFGSSLSLTDLELVLATLGVVDLAADPEDIDGIPSEAA